MQIANQLLLNLFWVIPVSFMIGLFVNFASDVLPFKRTLLTKPFCTKCKQTFDLFHYITFGKCRHCGTQQNLRHVLLPILLSGILTGSFLYLANIVEWIAATLIFTFLSMIFVIDLEHRLILHPTSIFGAVLFFIIGTITNGLLKTLLGGAAGFLIMFALYYLGIIFSKWMSKRRGEEIAEVALGFGDVNLSGVVGLLLGWPGIGLCLFFAILSGGLFSGGYLLIQLIKRKYEAFTPIPYAPFIILSSIYILYLSTTN